MNDRQSLVYSSDFWYFLWICGLQTFWFMGSLGKIGFAVFVWYGKTNIFQNQELWRNWRLWVEVSVLLHEIQVATCEHLLGDMSNMEEKCKQFT